MFSSKNILVSQIKKAEFAIWNLKLYQKRNLDDEVLCLLISRYERKIVRLKEKLGK